MEGYTYGIDLSNKVFHIVKSNSRGKVIAKHRVKREKFEEFLNSVPSGSVFCMEACSGSHYIASEIKKRGFEARILPAQHTKRFRTKQKNDFNDAKAIVTANFHEDVIPVGLKTGEELDVQAVHRIRDLYTKQKVQLNNLIRGFLRDRGRILRRGESALRYYVANLLEKDPLVSDQQRKVITDIYTKLSSLVEEIANLTTMIKEYNKSNPKAKKLKKVAGVGDVIASYAATHASQIRQFKNGRAFAASQVGLIPRQFSTGDETILGRVTKSGDPYFRRILVQGAKNLVRYAPKKNDPLSLWIQQLLKQKHKNVVAVAVANKLSRIIWHIMAHDEDFSLAKTNVLLNPCTQLA